MIIISVYSKRALVSLIILTLIISGLSMPHLDNIHNPSQSSNSDKPLLIPESVSGVVSLGQEISILSLNMTLNVMVSLPYRNQSELSSLLHSLQDRNSPLYHKFLSASQFKNLFSPASAEYSQYVNFFKNQGFSVTVYSDRVSIGLTGTVKQFDGMFNSTLMNFYSPNGNYFAPSRQLSLAVDYGNLSSVVGLNNRFKPAISPMFTGSNTSQVLYGGDLQNIYQLTRLYEQYGYPTNETIATILWSGTDTSGNAVAPYDPSDISYYFNHNIPSNEPKPVVYGYPILGAPPPGSSASTDQSSAHLESTLDLEMAGSTAPGAKIVEVYGPSATQSDLDQAFASILNPSYNSTVDSALSKIVAISNSWGSTDTNDTTWMQYEEEAAARGITVIASSGDNGNSGSPAPSFPASMSYDNFGTLAVGGTKTLLSGLASPNGTGTTGIQSQSVWYGSPSSTDGTQGGVSAVFQEPSWQVNSGDANSVILDYAELNGVSSGRGTPDVSAVGANMSIYVTSGSTAGYMTVWGTSISSPIIAGLIATVDNSIGTPEGVLNKILYNFCENQYQGKFSKTNPFYFVYNGSNALYPALHGYSLAVGWGSINAYNFAQDQLPTQIPYALNFKETGLPSEAEWYVNLSTGNNSGPIASGTEYTFHLDNGTYSYTTTTNNLSFRAPSGTARIDGSNVIVDVRFVGIYPVHFSETGLPVNTSWYLTITGGESFGPISSSNYSVYLENGSYSFTISAPTGYVSSPYASTFQVNGSPVIIPEISFVQDNFPSELVRSSLTFNMTEYLSETVSASSTNPAQVNFGSNSTNFIVNGTSNQPESFGNYTINVQKIEQMLSSSEITENTAVLSFALAGGTSFSYGGVNTQEIFSGGGKNLLTVSTYLSSSESTLDFNGTIFRENYPLPTLRLDFSTLGKLTISSSYSSGINGAYSYSQTYQIDFNYLYFNSTDNGFSSIVNQYHGWSVTTSPMKIVNYPVSFKEIGLPYNAFWYVNLSDRLDSGPIGTGLSYTIYLPNGTYNFTATNTFSSYGAYGREFTVNGEPIGPLTISFSNYTYPALFEEKGLPTGAIWYVNLTSGIFSGPLASGSTYSIGLPNGTHPFTFSTSDPLRGSEHDNGNITLLGGPTSIVVGFTYAYNVTFNEEGLPTGTDWYVNLSTGKGSGPIAGTSTVFHLLNGSYSFKVGQVMNYLEAPTSSIFTVNGSSISIETISFLPALPSDSWINSNFQYNLTSYMSESINVTPSNPAYVQFQEYYTKYQVNGTSSDPESYGNYTVNINRIEQLLNNHEIQGNNANFSFQLGGGTSYTYNGVGTNETITVGSERLLTLSTYISSYESTLDFNGTIFKGNYPLPTIYLNFSILGKLTIYSAYSSSGNGVFSYKHTFNISSNNLYFNTTDYGFYKYIQNKYYGWSVQVNPLVLTTYPVEITENGLPSNVFWFFNLTAGQGSGPIPSGSAYTVSLSNGTYSYSVGTTNHLYSTAVYPFSVNGAAVSINLFFAESFRVNFSEKGLPSGAIWYLNISNGQDSGPILAGSNYSVSLYNGTYNYTLSTAYPTYGPAIPSGTFNVRGSQVSEALTFGTLYEYTISESGLLPGTTWYVNLSNGVISGAITGSSFTFSLTNGTYSYTVTTSNKVYSPSPSLGSFRVNGTPVSESITFYEVKYTVTFSESNLPSGTAWYVNVTGSNGTSYNSGAITSSSFSFTLTNGSYSFRTATADKIYDPSISSSTLTVNGSTLSKSITFSEVLYPVQFTETGLPSGVSWYVNITESNGSTYLSGPISGSTYSFSLTNGSYTYKIASSNKIYAPNLTAGSFTVNGSSFYESITFSEVLYPVQFTETGLTSGASWYVNITETNGTIYQSGAISTTSYSLSLTNGSYSFTISSANKIYAPSYVSVFTVNGSSLTISATFTEILYNLTIQESGLPAGTEWNLTFGGTIYQLANTSYIFSVPNGTYSFLATSHDYKDVSGTITVNSSFFIYTINMELQLYEVTFNETGLPAAAVWYVNLSNGMTSGPITGSSYSFSFTNGSYSYTVATSNKTYYTSPTGSFTVNGTHISETIAFSKVTYVVTFTENGLPSGVYWYLNGSGLSGYESSQASISFNLSNGTYSYTVSNLSSFYTTTTHFTVIVSGKNVTENIYYYHWAYITGSITPTNSNLTLNGKLVSLTSSGSFYISVPNGTYHVVISRPGYISYYSNFTLYPGKDKNLTISLKHVSEPSTFISIDLYVITGAIVAVAAIGVAVVSIRKRK